MPSLQLGSPKNGPRVDTAQLGRCHAPIRSGQGSTGGGERHNASRSNPKVDSIAESQLAADPNSNDPAGQHQVKTTLSLSFATSWARCTAPGACTQSSTLTGVAKTVPVREFRTHLSELLSDVADRRDHVLVTRNGKPAAVLVPIDEYAALEETAEILSDPATLAAIEAGLAEIANGETVTLEELRSELAHRRSTH